MTDCNNTASINDLPECSDVESGSYIIVQKPTGTCKMKISDLVIGAENVDFYPELLQIVNKLDQILSVIQPNSGNWNHTHATVLTGKPVWDQTGEYNLGQLSDTITQNADKWNDTSDTVAINSGNWSSAYDRIVLDADRWSTTADTVTISQETFNYTQQVYYGTQLLPVDPLGSVWNTVHANSANW